MDEAGTGAQQPGPERVTELVDQLRARVAERRERGEYPPHLEQDLDAHFQHIVSLRAQGRSTFRERLDALDEAASSLRAESIPTKSRVPGGSFLHRMVAKAVHRQTAGVLKQVQEFAYATVEAFDSMAGSVAASSGPGLGAQLDTLHALVASQQQAINAQRADILSIIDRRIRAAQPVNAEDRPFVPWFENERFESAFRGSRKDLLERYRDLAVRLVGCDPVLDIGFGRGEMLELLEELGVQARGVEADPVLVKQTAERGFDVQYDDGGTYLRSLEDESLGGLVMIQVIEHLTAQDAMDVVALAARKVRRGGRVIIETVNPQSLYVFARSFYLDPTHLRPVHPAYVEFLFREAGFAEIEIDWRNPPRRQEALEELDGDDDATRRMNVNIANLNTLLFAPQDYAVIATR